MRRFLARNLLVVVVGIAALLALWLPRLGQALAPWPLIEAFVVVIFLCQGAGVDIGRFRRIGPYLALLGWGFVVAMVAAPAAGWAAMELLGWSGDDRVGFLLMCCVGPTLVSGIVIADQAGGEREAATLLTIVLNLVAVGTLPFALAWTVGGGGVDSLALLRRLLLLVLLPAIVGQVLRWLRPRVVTRLGSAIKLVPVFLLGATIYLALSLRAEHLRDLSALRVVLLVVPAAAVHFGLMALAYGGARGLLRCDRARATAAAVVCSQKTIPVAVAVWATSFATSHPLALIPPIVLHLTQIGGDGLLAAWWARRCAERSRRSEPPSDASLGDD